MYNTEEQSIGDYDSIFEYERRLIMSKVKIPLKWYSDLIKIPDTNNEYLLIEWFEEKECKTKTLLCLGKYLKITQYAIIGNQEGKSNKEITLDLMNNRLNIIKLGESIYENDLYFPRVYKDIKEGNFFEGDFE